MKKEEILGLRTVVYKVENLLKAKDWYSKVFETQPYFDEPFYVGFNIGGYELGLLPEDKGEATKGEGVIAYWGVNDINMVYTNMLESGAKEHEKPTNVGGELMVASVYDLWGNIIGLIYNPEFKL
ncbi:VOC family protein [Ancylomarina salipaludis]|uniref:VOC family protein n=1 Tax=Ancylomarina salipaludis TaxID=2501299 RepID=A0A4Q1JJN4_9BACT|nr:VOC family protein [Ancylomarina salipaludis]RXQ91483.1 VOC family protein [Ancylomarina salipaludis]